jgi:integrase
MTAAAFAEMGDLATLVRQQQETIARLSETIARLAGPKALGPSVTISELFARYTDVRQHEKNWRHVRARLDHLIWRLGDLPASELTPLKWAEHRSARATDPSRYGRPPCAHTLNLELARAKEMLKWAVANKLLDENPLQAAKRTRAVSARESWISEEDLQRLLEAAGTLLNTRRINGQSRMPAVLRAFILCCMDSMLRFNEARHLRRDRIAPDGTIELLAKETKTGRRRIVGLTPRTLAAIEAISTEDPRVFFNPERGALYSEGAIRTWFRRACEASGVDSRVADGDVRLHIHDLRHSGASAADARGASALAIRDALGHTKLSMTERYLHHHQRKSALALSRLMQANPGSEAR